MEQIMKSVPVITPAFLNDWKKAATLAGTMEESIVNRINYIVRTVYDVFKVKIDTWYFYGAGEGEVGDLMRQLDDNEINIITELARNKDGGYNSIEMVIIDKYGHEWGFEDSIPTRWLFEPFELELMNGKKNFEEKQAERKKSQKELSAQKKLEDAALATAAKAKLSKKELAALRRSL
jgi:hypothetical protein